MLAIIVGLRMCYYFVKLILIACLLCAGLARILPAFTHRSPAK